MNSYKISTLSILALAASALLIPVSTVAAGLTFTFAGVVAILAADYGRPTPALKLEPAAAGFQVSAGRKSGLRLAA
jgi:hypothetical protein